ncbi:hypothetical protein ACFPAF_07205 [Hymenobacter endophyticus]|uniref:Uncharacterized protein n=1 Tax=Hymenobacter endophyticus TaxID=3076335 RepID=A0ABU3TFL9_9BACT|nr:hypothetical protein [Hymenobacter endophyticus]MDU0370171.1 hypothetical protein [Hymenobacter endophyticus]
MLPLVAQASSTGAVNEFIRDFSKGIFLLVLLVGIALLASLQLPASGVATVIRLGLGLLLAGGVLLLAVASWLLAH